MRIYPDACIVIYLIEEHPRFFPPIDAWIRAHRSNPFVLSGLTRLECRVRPLRLHDHELLARFDRFFANQGHLHVAVTQQIFDLATELRARHNLKTPDALHLAAALDTGCEEFWTNDDRLEKAAAGRIAIVSFD